MLSIFLYKLVQTRLSSELWLAFCSVQQFASSRFIEPILSWSRWLCWFICVLLSCVIINWVYHEGWNLALEAEPGGNRFSSEIYFPQVAARYSSRLPTSTSHRRNRCLPNRQSSTSITVANPSATVNCHQVSPRHQWPSSSRSQFRHRTNCEVRPVPFTKLWTFWTSFKLNRIDCHSLAVPLPPALV